MGKVFVRGNTEHDRYIPPVHINCRHFQVFLKEAAPTFDPAKVTKKQLAEAHFVTAPQKYEPLRVPARPDGRDFVFKRVRGQDGKMVSRIAWRTIGDDFGIMGLDRALPAAGEPSIIHPRVISRALRDLPEEVRRERNISNVEIVTDGPAAQWSPADFILRINIQSLAAQPTDRRPNLLRELVLRIYEQARRAGFAKEVIAHAIR